VSRRGEDGAPRARRELSRVRTPIAALLFVIAVVATATVAGCGGSSDSQLAAYVGAWQRVVGGEPDPSLTLLVARTDDGASLTFTDQSGSRSEGVATLKDASLVMDMPAANGIIDGATRLQLSLDAGGQLVVDQVLDDGTTEPVWVYDRTSTAAP
jgi:type IV pilus biogenesis protein CpaD/CtpE